jgi:hypothetical protein
MCEEFNCSEDEQTSHSEENRDYTTPERPAEEVETLLCPDTLAAISTPLSAADLAVVEIEGFHGSEAHRLGLASPHRQLLVAGARSNKYT